MRYLLICAALIVPGVAAAATPMSEAIVRTCQKEGFKPGSSKFKRCQTDMINRLGEALIADMQAKQSQAQPVLGDGTPDDAECGAYGFQPGTAPYLTCRFNLKRLHDDDQRVAEARAQLDATNEKINELAAREPAAPPEPSLADRLLKANESYWDDRKRREAAQTTTRCHTDYNGDVKCTTD